MPAISIADGSVDENDTSSVYVSISNASYTGVRFTAVYTDGTAIYAIGDYEDNGRTYTIPAGQSGTYIGIEAFSDSLYEGAETFYVLLSGVVNATIADGTGLMTINDQNAQPAISVNDINIGE